jgi:hypothetical protein
MAGRYQGWRSVKVTDLEPLDLVQGPTPVRHGKDHV